MDCTLFLSFSYLKQETNLTVVTDFVLLGFQGGRAFRIVIFCLLLVIYCVTLLGNLLIMALVFCNKNLHTPMYFFISQLSMNDILLTTDIVPNMLYIHSNDHGTITFRGCIAQFYFFTVSEIFECLLLTVMSYDRYVAICKPLHYSSIMTRNHCVAWSFVTWIYSFSVSLIDTITISQLSFCKSNLIDHLLCDLAPLLEISCSDTSIIQVEVFVLSVNMIILPCLLITVSYLFILGTILRIRSVSGRQKAFSTCSSQLMVVAIFYGTMFGVYSFPVKTQSMSVIKVLSLLYTVGTPLLNPVIYSLKNKDIKTALRKAIRKNIYL